MARVLSAEMEANIFSLDTYNSLKWQMLLKVTYFTLALHSEKWKLLPINLLCDSKSKNSSKNLNEQKIIIPLNFSENNTKNCVIIKKTCIYNVY